MESTNEPNLEGVTMKMPKRSKLDPTLPTPPNTLMITLLLAALSLIFIGLFFWYFSANTAPVVEPISLRPTPEMNNEPESATAEAETSYFGAMATSDELDLIAADLEGTILDTLVTELPQITAELTDSRTE